MNILALDTSTEACSAALAVGDDIIERYHLAPREHANLILPMLEELLAEAQLLLSQIDAIAFGKGPGAFVGVRIAAGVTQGIAFAADLPVIPVSSLAALAQGAQHAQVLAAIDARMEEVYWGAFIQDENGLVQLSGKEIVTSPAAVPLYEDSDGQWFGVGSGWQSYDHVLITRVQGLSGYDGYRFPRAKHIAMLGKRDFQLGHAVDAAQALPSYLRNQVAKKPHK